MQRETRRIHYSGRVQGVGFRFTTQHLARGFDVAGQVRNLPDGRVEVVTEGEPAEIEGFLQAVRDAMGRFIRDESVESIPTSPTPLTGFTVRH
jgi:acylphosphatase